MPDSLSIDDPLGVAGSGDTKVPDSDRALRETAEKLRRFAARPAVSHPTVLYLASRALTSVIMVMVALADHQTFLDVVDRWDSRWFVRAAAHGWPSRLPMVHGHIAGNTTAFFPLLPLLFRYLSDVTGMSLVSSGALVSFVTGLTAVVASWSLVRRHAGNAAADRAALLLAFCPGSFAFSLIYTEGIVITLVALGLIALDRRKWVLAGLAGFAASATAPIALAFVVSAAWAAWWAVRTSRRKLIEVGVGTPEGQLVEMAVARLRGQTDD